jgi:hypothetical protein
MGQTLRDYEGLDGLGYTEPLKPAGCPAWCEPEVCFPTATFVEHSCGFGLEGGDEDPAVFLMRVDRPNYRGGWEIGKATINVSKYTNKASQDVLGLTLHQAYGVFRLLRDAGDSRLAELLWSAIERGLDEIADEDEEDGK